MIRHLILIGLLILEVASGGWLTSLIVGGICGAFAAAWRDLKGSAMSGYTARADRLKETVWGRHRLRAEGWVARLAVKAKCVAVAAIRHGGKATVAGIKAAPSGARRGRAIRQKALRTARAKVTVGGSKVAGKVKFRLAAADVKGGGLPAWVTGQQDPSPVTEESVTPSPSPDALEVAARRLRATRGACGKCGVLLQSGYCPACDRDDIRAINGGTQASAPESPARGTEISMATEISSYEDLSAEIASVRKTLDEHADPVFEAANALAKTWSEHGDSAIAGVNAAKAIHEAVTDDAGGQERFRPGPAVTGAIEALMEVAAAVSQVLSDLEEATERIESTSAVDGLDDAVAEAEQSVANEAAKIAEVADETGADVRLQTASA